MMKDLDYYMNLRYAVRIEPDPEEGFVGEIPDLPGCLAYGKTEAEALEDLEDSKELWLETYLETHGEAPEPRITKSYSGKLLLRLPRSLHRDLDNAAKEDGTSLNQHIVHLLSQRFGESKVMRLAWTRQVWRDCGWLEFASSSQTQRHLDIWVLGHGKAVASSGDLALATPAEHFVPTSRQEVHLGEE